MKIAFVFAACLALAAAQDSVPACRATDSDGHLLERLPGKTGCLTTSECQMYTDAGSYCKPDGTCQGCDSGCCASGTPAVMECAYDGFAGVHDDDFACQALTGCAGSYCKPDNTCHQCEPTPVEPTCDCSMADCGDDEVADCGDDGVCNCNQIQNPQEPECRQFYNVVVNGSDVAHLIPRGDGAMGCVDHVECQENTDAGSWCKADGTCAGCDDWEGCCVVADAAAALSPCDFGADNADDACKSATGCAASFCKDDDTCQSCTDPIVTSVPCVPSDDKATRDSFCKVLTGCDASYCKDSMNICKAC